MTSQHVPGFHGEDPGPAAQPWRPSLGEQPSASRGGSGGARWDRTRRAAAAVLATVFIVFLPAAVTSAWIRVTVLSASGYVAAVSDVAASPAVRAAIGEAVTAQVDAALPRAGGVLTGPLRTGLADLAGKEASAFTASPAFRRLWAAANQSAHSQLISVLNGNSALVSATGGQVVLNLIPLVNDVLHNISRTLSAMTGGTVTVPPVSTIPGAACQVLSDVSSRACQIPIFKAAALARLRHVYRILTTATWLVLALTPLAFAGALAASPHRRRTLLCMTIGGTLTLLLALTTLTWLQSSLTARADSRYQAVTSAVLHTLTSSFFTLSTWCMAGGLALAAATLLSGPYRWATAIRAALRVSG